MRRIRGPHPPTTRVQSRSAQEYWTMMKMDLNSDLGESFGAWRMGDDTAMLEVVTLSLIHI